VRHPATAGRKPNGKWHFYDITKFETVFGIADADITNFKIVLAIANAGICSDNFRQEKRARIYTSILRRFFRFL
jgi:hypothetical protein